MTPVLKCFAGDLDKTTLELHKGMDFQRPNDILLVAQMAFCPTVTNQ
jgi:hypothetical protein